MPQWSRRRLLRLLLLASAAVPLSSCGSGVSVSKSSAAGSAAAAPATKAPTSAGRAAGSAAASLSFMTWGDLQVQKNNQSFTQQFEQQHPGINVSFVFTPLNYYDKLQTMLAGNVSPDVFWLAPQNFPAYAFKQSILPIDSYVAADSAATTDVKDFYPAALDQFRFQGKLFGLPRGFADLVIYYAVNLFQNAGVALPPTDWNATTWDWNEFLAAAQKLTNTGQRAYGFVVDSWFRSWETFVFSNGGDLFDKTMQICTLTEPPAITALTFLQNLIKKYQVAPTTAQLTELPQNQQFLTNKVGMTVQDTSLVVQYRPAKFAWDVAPIPRAVAGRVTSASGPGWFISSQTKDKQGSWQLLQWLSGATVQRKEAADGTLMPPRQSIANSPVFLDSKLPPPHPKVFVDGIAHGRQAPYTVNWAEIQTALDEQMAYLFDGSRTPQDVAAQVKAAVDPLLAANTKQMNGSLP